MSPASLAWTSVRYTANGYKLSFSGEQTRPFPPLSALFADGGGEGAYKCRFSYCFDGNR